MHHEKGKGVKKETKSYEGKKVRIDSIPKAGIE